MIIIEIEMLKVLQISEGLKTFDGRRLNSDATAFIEVTVDVVTSFQETERQKGLERMFNFFGYT